MLWHQLFYGYSIETIISLLQHHHHHRRHYYHQFHIHHHYIEYFIFYFIFFFFNFLYSLNIYTLFLSFKWHGSLSHNNDTTNTLYLWPTHIHIYVNIYIYIRIFVCIQQVFGWMDGCFCYRLIGIFDWFWLLLFFSYCVFFYFLLFCF